MSGQQFFSEEDSERILKEAVQIQGAVGGMTRDRLLATAAELGISPEAVQQAEQRLSEQKLIDAARAKFRDRKRQKLRAELSSYLGTSVILLGINFLTGFGKGIPWSVWVIGIWGLAVVVQFIEWAFRDPANDQKEFERWCRRQKGPFIFEVRGPGHVRDGDEDEGSAR